MSTANPHEKPETKVSPDEQARLATVQAIKLMETGTSRSHANGRAMNEQAVQVPSFRAPITSESGYTVGELEVHMQGLNDKADSYGFFVTMSHGSDSDTNSRPYKRSYWVDRVAKTLYTVDQQSRGVHDSAKIFACKVPETIDVMEEVAVILEVALHPERQTSTTQNETIDSRDKRAKRRVGSFLGGVVRQVIGR